MPNFVNSISPADIELYAKNIAGDHGFVKAKYLPKKSITKIGAIGDSIVFGCNYQTTVSSLTISSGVLNADTSLHKGNTGQKFYLNGANEDDLVGPIFTMAAGLTTTTVGAVTTTLPDMTATGTITLAAANYAFNERDFLGWIAKLTKGHIVRGLALGFQGKNSDYIAGKVQYAIDDSPDAIIEMSGMNSISLIDSDSTPTEIVAAAKSIFDSRKVIWDALYSAGITPIISTIPPLSSTHVDYLANRHTLILVHNKLIIDNCFANPQFLLLDAYASIVDASSATGNHQIGCSSDGKHLTGRGAYRIAKRFVADFTSMINIPDRCRFLPTSAGEHITANAAIKQLNPNPTGNAGIAGTLTGGATGTVWTGWTVTGSAACMASQVIVDGIVKQVLTVTGSSAETIKIESGTYSNAVVNDDVLQAYTTINIKDAVNLTNCRGTLKFTVNGVVCYGEDSYPAGNSFDLSDKEFTIVSPKIFGVQLSTTSFKVEFTFTSNGSAVITIDPPALWVL